MSRLVAEELEHFLSSKIIILFFFWTLELVIIKMWNLEK